jgi:hypothetical protein
LKRRCPILATFIECQEIAFKVGDSASVFPSYVVCDNFVAPGQKGGTTFVCDLTLKYAVFRRLVVFSGSQIVTKKALLK